MFWGAINYAFSNEAVSFSKFAHAHKVCGSRKRTRVHQSRKGGEESAITHWDFLLLFWFGCKWGGFGYSGRERDTHKVRVGVLKHRRGKHNERTFPERVEREEGESGDFEQH